MATFYNQATLSYRGDVTHSNVVSGEIVEVLTAEKTALAESYTVGDTVGYAVSLVNTGTTPVTGVVITDNLGAYTVGDVTAVPLTYVTGSVRYFADGVLQPAPTAQVQDETLVISGVSVPADGDAMVLYTVTVNDAAPMALGGSIVNTASVDGPDVPTALETDATIFPAAAPLLSITKAVSPVSVSENGTLTYTFQIQNTGNTATQPGDEVVVSDVFEPILSDLTVTLDGAPLALGTEYTYDETTGTFATLPGVIEVPAAAYTQDKRTGEYTAEPGNATLIVSGTV